MEYVTPNQITNTNLGPPVVWTNGEFMWTSVPKNANMAYRRFCRATSMDKTLYHESMSPQFSICVFRNPVHRLFSALGEYRKRKKVRLPIGELLERLKDDPSGFDEHLEPQLIFTQGKAYTHILKFENLNSETKNIPYFSNITGIIDQFITPDAPTTSKYWNNDLNSIYTEFSALTDDIINKYYTKDVLIWQNRENYIRKLISYDTV